MYFVLIAATINNKERDQSSCKKSDRALCKPILIEKAQSRFIMTEIFKFENHQVRFVGTADDPWWVAADICAVLEIDNNRQALTRLDNDEKCDVIINDTIGREQTVKAINESGLYSLILTSRKPQAKKFKKWVTSEVLPAIRKTGSYSVKSQTSLSINEAIALSNVGFQAVQNIGIEKEVAEQIRLQGLMQMFPNSKQLLKPYNDVLATQKSLPEMPMTPTEVGHQLALRLGYPGISI